MALLLDDIKTELHFVEKHWRLSGRPYQGGAYEVRVGFEIVDKIR